MNLLKQSHQHSRKNRTALPYPSKILMLKTFIPLLFAFVSSYSTASQDFAECRQFFPGGVIPVVDSQQSMEARALCFSSFAILHSGKSKTPIYVVQKLNKETLIDAGNNQRTNQFFPDARLPRAERAELVDYRESGFDRGHMAPAGDMTTSEGMAQSFSLANMVPQAPINNRKAWAGIEKATRKYVLRAQGDVFVMTGPVFDSNPEKIGPGQVWIPKYLFKLVYDPNTQRSWAHWLENIDEARPSKPISAEELLSRTGIHF